MEIRRVVSEGSSWPVRTCQLPALLEVLEEQQIPVEFSPDQGTGRVSLLAEPMQCRLRGPGLRLDASGHTVRIDLNRVAEARVVSRQRGGRRQFSVELLGAGRSTLLTLTGPVSGSGHAADVWELVVEALLPAAGTGSRQSPIDRATAAFSREGGVVPARAADRPWDANSTPRADARVMRSAAMQGT